MFERQPMYRYKSMKTVATKTLLGTCANFVFVIHWKSFLSILIFSCKMLQALFRYPMCRLTWTVCTRAGIWLYNRKPFCVREKEHIANKGQRRKWRRKMNTNNNNNNNIERKRMQKKIILMSRHIVISYSFTSSVWALWKLWNEIYKIYTTLEVSWFGHLKDRWAIYGKGSCGAGSYQKVHNDGGRPTKISINW